ncbi:LPXTG cell wall anchor domain-containing protein [Listeria valentina]|uniref:LPXTG cell wall anchor domain-containing protein n=1 Tax=Listeria valentina TaxID=2705293 RepID=UPI00142F9058
MPGTSCNVRAKTGSSRHITKKALPSTGDQEMTLKVALGAFLALIAFVSLYSRKKKLQ